MFLPVFASNPGGADPIHEFWEEFIEENRHLVDAADEQCAARHLNQVDDLTRQSLPTDSSNGNGPIFHSAFADYVLIEFRARNRTGVDADDVDPPGN